MIASQIPVQQPMWGPYFSDGVKKCHSFTSPSLGMHGQSVPDSVAVGKTSRYNWASFVSLASAVSRPSCLCFPICSHYTVLQSQESAKDYLASGPPSASNDGSCLPCFCRHGRAELRGRCLSWCHLGRTSQWRRCRLVRRDQRAGYGLMWRPWGPHGTVTGLGAWGSWS